MFLRDYRSLLLAPLLIIQTPAIAQNTSGSVNKSPSATDVAETPLRDINMKKTKIPPVLIRASEAPYSLAGLKSCGQIAGAIRQLDAAMGEDIDDAHAQGHAFNAGHLAQSVVDSVIPFSGVIKEVSGAAAEQRHLQAAVLAGFARRGFLKGVGLGRHCPAPARPA